MSTGECIQNRCHNIPPKNKSRCLRCSNRRSNYDKRIRQERIQNNLCAECGCTKSASTKLCTQCKEKSLARVHKYLFGGHKPNVLSRDKHSCVLCTRDIHLVVHHVNGNSSEHSMENLISLCQRCHADIHRLGKFDTRVMACILVAHSGTVNNSGRKRLRGWTKTRRQILARDKHACVLCDESEKALFIHHKDDRGIKSPRPNHNSDNLVTLCQPCHNAVTNLRNNADRQGAARLVISLGAGTQGTPATLSTPELPQLRQPPPAVRTAS